jgi:predicted signal transduction protein with EAL and GGDEF domain
MRWSAKSRNAGSDRPEERDGRDEVTGLFTYRAFLRRCADALEAQRPTGGPLRPAVLLVELRGVAETGEAGGRSEEEELLRILATTVSCEVGSLGSLARMSDHQFGVLFEDLSAPVVALAVAKRVATVVSEPVVLTSQRQVMVTALCGLVTRDVVHLDAEARDLVRGADLALREARRSGGGTTQVCSPALFAVDDETVAIGRDLRQSIHDEGLSVCYQPLVDLADGSVLGFEALVRWDHTVRGPVSPALFVPVAEAFGLVSDMGRMVLDTATRQVQEWSMSFGIPLNVHVNIAAKDLADDNFVAMVEKSLEESGLSPTQLVLEVTEGAVERILDIARERFDALHELRVRVALDNFGTGRSALSYLAPMAIDILKVDRSYLDSVDKADTDTHLVDHLLRGVIAFGHALGVTVYGEGIETEAQRQRLRSNGCDIGQGFLCGRPLPPDEAAVWLLKQISEGTEQGDHTYAPGMAPSIKPA